MYSNTPPLADSAGTCSILKFSNWIFVVVSWAFLSLVSDMPIIWKSFFDFDMRLSNWSKWNDKNLTKPKNFWGFCIYVYIYLLF